MTSSEADVSTTESAEADLRGTGQRVPLETWQWIRRRVEESGVPINQIARETGVPASTITSRIRREGWLRRARLSAELAQATPEERSRLISRLYSAFEKQVGRIEQRLRELAEEKNVSLAETDHLSRTLTSLAKTLDTLITLQDAHGPAQQEEGGADDDVRNQLARRLEALCAGGQDGGFSQ